MGTQSLVTVTLPGTAGRSLGDPQDEPAQEHQREGDGGQQQGGEAGVLGDQPEAGAGEGEGGELDPEVGEEGRRLRHLRQIGVAGQRRKALAPGRTPILAAWRLCVPNPFLSDAKPQGREAQAGCGTP
jgi:hypothetical protein